MYPLMILAAIEVKPIGAALIVAVAVAALLAGKVLFAKDTEIENRRRAANEVAGTLRAMGLRKIPAILSDYAVGDYSGMVHEIKGAARDLLDPKVAEAEFGQLFERMLEVKMRDPETRKALVDKVARLNQANEPVAVAA